MNIYLCLDKFKIFNVHFIFPSPMKTLDPSREQIKALVENLPDNQRIVMLNLLKFKDKVEATGKSGLATYREYGEQVAPFLAKAGGKVLWQGKPMQVVIGPPDEIDWDEMVLVEYPSKTHFLGMIKAPNYPSALRTSALEDSRLIANVSMYNLLDA